MLESFPCLKNSMFHFPCYLEIFSMVIQPKSSVFHSFSMLFHPRLENAWKKSPRFMDISRTKPWKTLETVSNSRDFHGIPCYTMDFQPKFHDYPGQCTPGSKDCKNISDCIFVMRNLIFHKNKITRCIKINHVLGKNV